MGQVGSLFRDRRRAQRGSVLSGVLIITAFLAIISGALMTELSTNFLLTQDLMKRVSSQATVKSSVDLAIDSVQNAPFTSACPALTAAPTLNGLNASVSYSSCALVTDNNWAANPIANSAPFTVDGSYVSLPGLLPGQGNEYLVADSGRLFAYPFGTAAASWSYPLPGTPTAPPMAMSAGNGDVADLVPISNGEGGGGAVALLAETTPGQQPSLKCTLATASGSSVIASPAAGRDAQNVVFFGDQSGRLYAFDASTAGSCSSLDQKSVSGQPIVAGPVVFPQSGSRDRLFLVVSDAASSTLMQYRYSGNSQSFSHITPDVALPAGTAVGMAADSTTLPARLAITFSGGEVAIVHVSSSFNMTPPITGSLPAGSVNKPPAWCQACLGGAGMIGVGSSAGLYLFDSSLNPYSSFAGAAITTAPAADVGGDWFAGGANGTIFQLRAVAGGAAVPYIFSAGSGTIRSSPVVNTCPATPSITFTHLCVYFGATNSRAYLIPLDAREAVLSACVTCTPGNLRLWTHVVVGAATNPRAVRVVGFSYYSA
jgi:hypothetical protein